MDQRGLNTESRSDAPSASLVICTRDRTAGVDDAVRAALETNGDAPVYVIDQNHDGRIDGLLEPLLTDSRLRHVKTTRVGVSRARNLALDLVDTDVVCFTDDDCIVAPDYVTALVSAFRKQPDATLIYCSVEEPRPMSSGYTPVHEPSGTIRHTKWGRDAQFHRLGLGAGMAVRVEPVLRIGGFDPVMGPGGRFPSADDREIAVRLLLAGHQVAQTPEPVVTHHGFRPDGAEARALTRRDHTAIGAFFAKVLRVHPAIAAVHLLAFTCHSLAEAVRVSIRLRRPAGIGKIAWTIDGLVRGLQHPVERMTLTFLDCDEPDGQTITSEPHDLYRTERSRS